jgi:hypothetical protein
MTDRWGRSVSGVRERSGKRGPGVSSGERGGVPVRGLGIVGLGWPSRLGPIWSPRALFLFFISFSISFSVFLIYFIYFAYLLQFDPNKILKTSNHQSNVVN